MMEFSVIITVFHESPFLREILASTRQLDLPSDSLEFVVVGAEDNEEARHLVEVESSAAEISFRYIGCASSNRSKWLNVACADAQGNILVFTEDDCVLMPDWLQKLWEVFQREANVGAVGGVDELEHGGSTFDLALDWVLNSFVGTGGLRRKYGSRIGHYYPKLWNMAVPREIAFQAALRTPDGLPQLFNEYLDVNEDVDLVNRIKQLGKSIVFAPEVRVKHYRVSTFLSFTRRNFYMARTCRSLGVHRLPQSVLASFALGVPALAISSIFFPFLSITFLICLGSYIAILIMSAIAGFIQMRKLSAFILIPLLLASLHFARGLGYLFPLREDTLVGR
jgi:GT2 family glycosyltransferase